MVVRKLIALYYDQLPDPGGLILTHYKDSAQVSAFAGTHASGRAGQHSELFDSILGRVKKGTTQIIVCAYSM